MKKISIIKLNALSDADLNDREKSMLIGGIDPTSCGCGCNYTSTTLDNRDANSKKGYSQSGGGNKTCAVWYDENGNGKFDSNEYTLLSTY